MIPLPRMGFGSAPIGNLYTEIKTEDALETIQGALGQGVTLLDTAPLYGLGLAEERIGMAIAGQPRESFTLSTKIGRVLNADNSDFSYDYSYDGVLRSLEGSLARLRVDSIDILHIHEADPAADQEAALTEAYPTLLELREQGVIKAISAGMNAWPVLEKLVRSDNYDFDLFLLAGRYTLLEQGALSFLNLCRVNHIGILAAGIYNSGILATGAEAGAKYNYANAAPEIVRRVQAIAAVCSRHDVQLNVAALNFVAAHPAVRCLVVGAASAQEIRNNLQALEVAIPSSLWAELRARELVDADAPLPIA